MIYLDNAATTPLDDDVLEVMLPYFKENFGNAQSQHGAGRACANALSAARDKIASLAGCKANELYFVSCGTEAGNTALKGVCTAYGKGHIIVSSIEHPSITASAEDMEKSGFEVTYIDPDRNGVIQPESVKKAIRKDTIFCAVMAGNNETGVIQPVEEIGAICRGEGVFYYADCVQTAPYLPLPVKHVDGLGFSSHKFYGPKGAGALYIKSGSKINRLISGGKQERGLRAGTVNTAAVVGMAAAYEKTCLEMDKNSAYIGNLRNIFVKKVLEEIDGTALNGEINTLLPSLANISFNGCAGENILFLLDLKGICVSTGAACSAGAVTPSRALTSMGITVEEAKSSVRFSFGKHNTLEEVEKSVEELKIAVKKIRNV